MTRDLTALDREQLATLGREWMLHGHLQDRVAMALMLESFDRETMQQVAIEEWMAASPVYSRRMQQAMGFGGDGVSTIVKNLQLDIGAPHQFMDFRYRLTDEAHGEFWLDHCGALMDVEPMGEKYVLGMCHDIEDPTFDATAAAVNPHAQVRPIHRPPRVPSGRTPHCQWRIDIVDDGPAVTAHPNESLVAASQLARLPIQAVTGSHSGWDDYSGAFDPDFCLEDLSHAALLVVMREFAIQSQLLMRSFLIAAAHRRDDQWAAGLLPRLLRGWGGLTAQRIAAAFDIDHTVAGLQRLIELHPLFAPADYIGLRTEITGDALRVSMTDCVAMHETDDFSWARGLGASAPETVAAILQAFDPLTRAEPAPPTDSEIWAANLTLDQTSAPAKPAAELFIAQISTGARFVFRPRRQVRV